MQSRLKTGEDAVVRAFHRLYYDGAEGRQRPFENTQWMGVACLKCPLDLWAYQEIVFETQPDLIIETGSYMGGSALFLAHLFDLMGKGRVVSIDIEHRERPQHPRITYFEGSSTADDIVSKVKTLSRDAAKVLVILDSDHSEAHVTRELELFAPLVTPGSYLIVEDTNVNGHPVHDGFGPGPYEAVSDFLPAHPEFRVDAGREKFFLTFNPRGFLKRLTDSEMKLPIGSADPHPDAATRSETDAGPAFNDPALHLELESSKRDLRKVSEAFREAMAQLAAATEANAGFKSALTLLSERDAELGATKSRLAERENRLAMLEAHAVVAKAGSKSQSSSGWLQASDSATALAPAAAASGEVVYQGRIDLKVKNNSHTLAYEFIEEVANNRRLRVLEAGCGSGYFGEAVKRAGHEVWGVETSAVAAATAVTKLDRVFQGTVEELFAGLDDDIKFDCVTFGDVLEHLVDPRSVLRRVASNLTAEGAVVASIPNVAHVAVRAMLLEGRWDYSDVGILDKTHLHFFTKRSVVKLFSDAGYRIEAITPVRLPAELTGIQFEPDRLRSLARAPGDDATDVFQYVVLARPATQARPVTDNDRYLVENGRKVLCLMPVLDWSLGQIRLKNPLNKWSERFGGTVMYKWMGDFDREDLAWADVVVLQRESDPRVIQLINALHRYGKTVVFDIDDLLTEIPEFLSTYEHGLRIRPHLQKTLGLVDAVTVTTARLRDRLLPLQPSTYVVPNCPRPAGLVADQRPDAHSGLTVVIASTDTVRVDFLIPALKMIAADSSLKVEFVGVGPPGKAIREAGIPIRCVETLSYEQFLHLVAGLTNPVGLIPLDASTFSSCKSPIKFLDYSMAGVVSVCSNVPPYSDLVEHAVTGLLVNDSTEAWYAAVKQLATTPSLRQSLAKAARSFATERYSLKGAAQAWEGVFSKLPPTVPLPPGVRIAWPFAGKRDWLLLLTRPSTYRAVLKIVSQEGLGGVSKRIRRLRG